MATISASQSSLWQQAEYALSENDRSYLAKAKSTSNQPADVYKDTQAFLNIAQAQFKEKGLSITVPMGQGKRKRIFIRDVFRSAAGWLESAMTVGDKIIQFDQSGHSALPWAGIKLLLSFTIQDKKHYDKIMEGIATITHNLTFYAEWERIYAKRDSNSSGLGQFKAALVELYTSILRYQAHSIHFFEKNRASRLGRGAFSGLIPNDRFTEELEALSKAEEEAAKVATLLDADLMQHMDDQFSFLQEDLQKLAVAGENNKQEVLYALDSVVQPIKAISDYVDANEMDEVLDWYSTIQYQMNHDKVHENIVPGTGQWLLAHLEFTRWLSASSSALLWLHGTLGMGKSSLVSIVIEHLRTISSSSKIGLPPPTFFYFVRGSESASDRDVFSTLARQLANLSPDQRLVRKARELCRKNKNNAVKHARALPSKKLTDLIVELTAEYPMVWIIVDALDESDDAADVFDGLQDIMNKARVPVKVFVSSREYLELKSLYKTCKNISVKDGRHSGDLAAFIDSQMNGLIRKKKLMGSIVNRKDKEELTDRIRSSLIDHADGMFRWAEMRLLELCSSKYRLKRSIINDLEKSPAKLSEIYEHIYQDLSAAGETIESRFARATLSWLLHAVMPLNRKQLMKAIRFYGDPGLEEDEVNDNLILNILPGFFTHFDVVGPYGVLEFAHLSVREHFEKHPDYLPPQAHAHIATSCLRVLSGYANSFAYNIQYDRDSARARVAAEMEKYNPSPSSSDETDPAKSEDEGSISSVIILHNFEHLEFEARQKRRRRALAKRQREQLKGFENTSQEPDEGISHSSDVFSPWPRVNPVSRTDFVHYVGIGSTDEAPLEMESPDSSSDADMSSSYMGGDMIGGSLLHVLDIRREDESEKWSQDSEDDGSDYSPSRSDRRRTRSNTSDEQADTQILEVGKADSVSSDRDPDLEVYNRQIQDELRTAVQHGGITPEEAHKRGMKSPLPDGDSQSEDDDDRLLVLARYPQLQLQEGLRRKAVQQGEMTPEEARKRSGSFIVITLLAYARRYWGYHCQKSALTTDKEFADFDLAGSFEDFEHSQPMPEDTRTIGLPFVLWFDWMRQNLYSADIMGQSPLFKKALACGQSQSDKWIVRWFLINCHYGLVVGVRKALQIVIQDEKDFPGAPTSSNGLSEVLLEGALAAASNEHDSTVQEVLGHMSEWLQKSQTTKRLEEVLAWLPATSGGQLLLRWFRDHDHTFEITDAHLESAMSWSEGMTETLLSRLDSLNPERFHNLCSRIDCSFSDEIEPLSLLFTSKSRELARKSSRINKHKTFSPGAFKAFVVKVRPSQITESLLFASLSDFNDASFQVYTQEDVANNLVTLLDQLEDCQLVTTDLFICAAYRNCSEAIRRLANHNSAANVHLDHRVLVAAAESGYDDPIEGLIFPFEALLYTMYPKGEMPKKEARKFLHRWLNYTRLGPAWTANLKILLNSARLSAVPEETIAAILRSENHEPICELLARGVPLELDHSILLLALQSFSVPAKVKQIMRMLHIKTITFDMMKAVLSDGMQARRMWPLLLSRPFDADVQNEDILSFAAEQGLFGFMAEELERISRPVDFGKLKLSVSAIGKLPTKYLELAIAQDRSLQSSAELFNLLVLGRDLDTVEWFLSLSSIEPQPETILAAITRGYQENCYDIGYDLADYELEPYRSGATYDNGTRIKLLILSLAPQFELSDEILLKIAQDPNLDGEALTSFIAHDLSKTLPEGFWSSIIQGSDNPARAQSILNELLRIGIKPGIQEQDLVQAANSGIRIFELFLNAFLENDGTQHLKTSEEFLTQTSLLPTLLDNAARNGSRDVLDILLSFSPASMQKERYLDITNLLQVCRARVDNLLKTLRALLAKGTPCDLPDASGRTPLSWAAASGFQRRDAVWEIVPSRSSYHRRGERDELNWSYLPDQAEMIKALVSASARLESRDSHREWTPLMWAAWAFMYESVDALLALGADVCATNEKGETAASLAREHGHLMLAKELEALMEHV